MESIDSIDTVYRNDSVDIVEYNPTSNSNRNSIFNRDIENNQLTSILLRENKNKNQIPTSYYIGAFIIIGFFVAVTIIIVLDFFNIS
jgi:hypothetical protein